MNLLSRHRVSFTTTLKTFRNAVSPPNVVLRAFAAVAGNLESESAMIAASCKEKKVVEPFGLLKAMIEKSVEPDLVAFNAVIQGLCGEKRLSEAEEVLEEMNRKGLVPDEKIYTSLIHLCCKRLQPTKAYKVLNEMIGSGFSPSVATYNELIHAYCRYKVDEAVGILRGMAERGLSPDAASYRPFIAAFLENNELGKALEMKKEMVEKGILFPDAASYSPFISMFCENNELGKALEMKKEMDEKGILPDADTYKSLISGLCGWKPRRLSEAFDLFREMLRGGLSPDRFTYFRLMNACCAEGEFSKAIHLHDEVIHMGFRPDFVTGFSPSLVTYNALIHGYCFLERVDEALEILRGTAEMGLSPDAVSYNTVLSGFCKIGEPGKAYELKVEMDEKRIWWLDEDTCESLMADLSDEVAYSSLMNAFCAEGNMEKVYNLEYEVDHNGSLPASVLFSALLNGLNKKGRTLETKKGLLSQVSEQCLCMPSYTAYDTLIENCCDNEFKSVVRLVKGLHMRGLVDEAARAHDTMLHGNYKPDGAVYNLLIFDHCRSLNVHKAYSMYMEMLHYGFAPHIYTVLALIKALHYDGRSNEMSCVIRNTLRSCNLNDSELLKVLKEIDVRECKINALLDVLAEIAMDGMLLSGENCSYPPASE